MTPAQNIISVIEENDFGTIGTDLFVTSPRFARSSIFLTPTGGETPTRTIGGSTAMLNLNFTITVVKTSAEDVVETSQNLTLVLNEAIVPGVSLLTVANSTPVYQGEGTDGLFYCQFEITAMVPRDQFDVEYVLDGNVAKGTADFS